MRWVDYFRKSPVAVRLETALAGRFKLVEHSDGLPSTANTDVEEAMVIINLDVTQDPIKCALSYAYELKNLENAAKYKTLIDAAKNRQISKLQFINNAIDLEAEAAYFRCQVYIELSMDDGLCPFNRAYLRMFVETSDLTHGQRVGVFAQYIKENALVRRQFSAKKYYADSFDCYSGKCSFPGFYDKKPGHVMMVNHAEESYFDELEKPSSIPKT
ncbi:hypothetical protein [Legionella waltersii]|uniref:Uncharacterized protein n=1 Tax=Legionella waltersii TaxID=66969 RepID=A0A0W1A4V3_9GAMM|nr:hypothetical protein [Legionella waltersii]KTD76342.1 hypothetical protein Lwal_2064 [Legionella waltersii]SNV13837.1 Uncharacterised protein [Legionella waltersii]